MRKMQKPVMIIVLSSRLCAMNWNDLSSLPSYEHLGHLADELAAARTGAIVVPLADLGLIRVSGSEAGDFLHNLLTNDIRHLGPDSIRRAGLCTPKGRLIASFELWRDGDDYLLLLSRDILPAILKKLSMYVLRSKVKLADASQEIALIGLAGTVVRETCGEQAAMSAVPFSSGRLLRLDETRAILAVPVSDAASAANRCAASATPAGMAAWRLLEIGSGIPRITGPTQELFVPQMVNYELPAVGGVSFQKGCYPGQEIVARTHYLGKVKRRMFRARLEKDFPAGTDVFTPDLGEQHCGALVLTAPAPEGGYECLVCAQTSAKEADAVFVGSVAGAKLEFLPLPYPIA